MKCSQCQAEVKLEPGSAETDCPYCGASVSRPVPRSGDIFNAMFADENGNGIPDFMEALGASPGGARTDVAVSRSVSQRFMVNGVTYDSVEAMPEEARRIFEGLNVPVGHPVATRDPQSAAKRATLPGVVVGIVIGVAVAGFLIWLLGRG